MSRRELLLAGLLCAALAALLFAQPLFLGRCILAFTVDDPRIDMRPWARPSAEELPPILPIAPDTDGFVLPGLMRIQQLERAGDDPWWDSGQMLGYPLAANLPFPIFSPFCQLARVLEPVSTLDWLLWFHTAVALALAYRACRMLGARPPAAALGAVGFALSAFTTTRWHSLYEVFVLAWWPAQVGALEWLRRGATRRALLEGTAATALMAVSGFPQTAAIMTLGTVALALLDRELRRLRVAWALGAMLVLGNALAAPQWLLSGDAFAQSLRARPEARAAALHRGLPPVALAQWVYPEFFGRPSDFSRADPPAPTMEEWLPHRRWIGAEAQNSVVYNALYPGALLVLLLPVLLRRRLDGRMSALMLAAGLALAAALLSPLIAPALPGAERLATGPVKRLIAIAACCWPLAGALALQALAEGRARAPWRMAALLVLALVATPWLVRRLDDPQAAAFSDSLAGQSARQVALVAAGLVALVLVARAPGRARAVAWAPAALLALDLGGVALAFSPFPEQQPPFPRTPALEALAARPGRYAVFGGGPGLLPATAAAVHGLRSLGGVAPMVPARAAELLGCVEGPLFDASDPRLARPFLDEASLAHPLLDLLDVATIVHADRDLAARSGLPVVYESEVEGLGALARERAGPRAFVCGGAQVVPDAAERLARLASRDFPVHGTVLLERPPRAALPEQGPMRPVEVRSAAAGRFELASEAPFDGVLVLTEAWDPGWSARVDGAAAPVLVADHALLAVELPAGAHAVVLSYRPRGLTAAWVAVAVSALLLAGLLIYTRPARAEASRSREGWQSGRLRRS